MQIHDAVLIPIIISIVELLKFYGLKKKLIPLISIALGIAGAIIYVNPNSIKEGILVGIVMGLSACGLYSGGKTLMVQGQEIDK